MPRSLSLRDQVELALLRVLSIILSIVDSLFNVRLGKRVLDNLTQRWQAQLAELDAALDTLEKERAQVLAQTEALSVHAAALYLGGRSLTRGELRFDPSDARDEEILDATIDLLVKQQLAAIEVEETAPGAYVYHLEPNWPAIRARLAEATAQAEPEIADWFREGVKFIDKAISSETDA